MTGDVAVAAPQDELTQIVGAMEKRRVKRLPIVENGKLVGIVSRADLVRALVHSLTAQAAPSARREASDDEIRAAIAAIIDEESWGPRFSIEVAVHAGIVDLRGTITDERARTALVVAAENVPGVKDVHDHLVWVEPTLRPGRRRRSRDALTPQGARGVGLAARLARFHRRHAREVDRDFVLVDNGTHRHRPPL